MAVTSVLKPVAGFEKGQSNEPVTKIHLKMLTFTLLTFETYGTAQLQLHTHMITVFLHGRVNNHA